MSERSMWTEGVIVTDAGEVIAKPGMTLDELRATRLGSEGEIEPTGPGYQLVRLGRGFRSAESVWPLASMEIDSCEWCGGPYFFHELLHYFDISLLPGELDRLGLHSFEEQQQFYEAFIEERIGRKSPAEFPWGRILAATHPWDFARSIVVRYCSGPRA